MPNEKLKFVSDVREDGSITFNNVNLRINGKTLISQASCKIVHKGKTLIIGANGAGKSLFLRLIAGLLTPSDGDISIDHFTPIKNDRFCFSLVFQKPVLLRRSTFENIAYVLRHCGTAKSEINNLVEGALKAARLEHRAQTPAQQLSGGEQQRLALARALVTAPCVLLLDEPTASLDPASTSIVEEMMLEAEASGMKVILVTHDIKQAKRIGDDIIFIHDGKILAHSPAKEFFKNPGSSQAQCYLDGKVFIPEK